MLAFNRHRLNDEGDTILPPLNSSQDLAQSLGWLECSKKCFDTHHGDYSPLMPDSAVVFAGLRIPNKECNDCSDDH